MKSQFVGVGDAVVSEQETISNVGDGEWGGTDSRGRLESGPGWAGLAAFLSSQNLAL